MAKAAMLGGRNPALIDRFLQVCLLACHLSWSKQSIFETGLTVLFRSAFFASQLWAECVLFSEEAKRLNFIS